MVTLITGPVRAGKSDFARTLALASGRAVLYVATARPGSADAEWTDRIAKHRRDRPSDWTTIESAGPPRLDLAALARDAQPGATILVDSLGTWIADYLVDEESRLDTEAVAVAAELDALAGGLVLALAATRATAIVVSEETGWGIVPPTPMGRVFRDVLGRLNRRVAAVADAAYLVVAGYALDLKTGRSVCSPDSVNSSDSVNS